MTFEVTHVMSSTSIRPLSPPLSYVRAYALAPSLLGLLGTAWRRGRRPPLLLRANEKSSSSCSSASSNCPGGVAAAGFPTQAASPAGVPGAAAVSGSGSGATPGPWPLPSTSSAAGFDVPAMGL